MIRIDRAGSYNSMFDMSRVRDCWDIYILVSFFVVSLVLESLEALVESLLLNLGVAVSH